MAVANGSGRSYKTKGSGATHLGRCGSSAKGLRSCSDDATAALGAVDHRRPRKSGSTVGGLGSGGSTIAGLRRG
uniref:Uncharacterized protein n=1 Tax=Oryza nivara TaxID=4536 RepID=A0A0E0GS81_ORYNI